MARRLRIADFLRWSMPLISTRALQSGLFQNDCKMVDISEEFSIMRQLGLGALYGGSVSGWSMRSPDETEERDHVKVESRFAAARSSQSKSIW